MYREKAFNRQAEFDRVERVIESYQGKIVWDGLVYAYRLIDHPSAACAYAWSSPIEGRTERRFFAVLHIPPIASPIAAVRAAVVAEHKSDRA